MLDPIKVLEIDTKLLEACDVSHLVKLFFKDLTRVEAKKLCGRVILTFPKYDNDMRPNCTIPEIRDFMCRLDKKGSGFPYFYVDDKSQGIHLQHLACLSPVKDIELSSDGATFGLRLSSQQLVLDYIGAIEVHMRRIGYKEAETSSRIQSILQSIGLQA